MTAGMPEVCMIKHTPTNRVLPVLYPSQSEASADLHIMLYLRKLDNVSELESLGSSFMFKKKFVDTLFDRYNFKTPERAEFTIIVLHKEQLNQEVRTKLHDFLKRELLHTKPSKLK